MLISDALHCYGRKNFLKTVLSERKSMTAF